MTRYAAALRITRATRTNYGRTLPLPQDFADMIGWPEQVATVAAVVRRAAAVALFACTETSITGAPAGEPVRSPSLLEARPNNWEEYWGEVSEAARSSNPWGVDEEQSVPIFVCRRPRLDLPSLFRRVGPDWG